MIHVLALAVCNKALFSLCVKNNGFGYAVLSSSEWAIAFLGGLLLILGILIIYEAALHTLVL